MATSTRIEALVALPAASVAVHVMMVAPLPLLGNCAGHDVDVEPSGKRTMIVGVTAPSQPSVAVTTGSATAAPTAEPASVGRVTSAGTLLRTGASKSRATGIIGVGVGLREPLPPPTSSVVMRVRTGSLPIAGTTRTRSVAPQSVVPGSTSKTRSTSGAGATMPVSAGLPKTLRPAA